MAELFAVVAPGLAAYTAQELVELNLLPAADGAGIEPGGVTFAGGKAAIYRANLHLRTANRVLVRLGAFRAVGFDELRKFSGRLAWERYLTPGQPVALRVTCHKSRLYHSDAVAQRVAAAIGDRLGVAPPLQKFDEESDAPDDQAPPQIVLVRLLHDQATISIDASGALLHRRGYRLATAKAPLRTTLAAGLLRAAGWQPNSSPAPLLDPFCGAGTIAIEAALLALGAPPGRQRRFAFMQWPDFDGALWAELLAAADAQQQGRTTQMAGRLQILASDRDAGAIAMAQANAARAGVAEAIEFSCRPVSAIDPPPGPGWMVTNPPYGLRVGEGSDLRNLYAQLGKVLRSRCPDWRVALLATDRKLLGQLGLPLDTSLGLVNGGIRVMAARGVVGHGLAA